MADTTSLAGILAASAAKPTSKGLTQAEIDAETAKQVAAGIKSTSKAAKLEGETYAEANARLTAAYKAQTAPELTQEGKAAGAQIKFVRTEAGGIGEFKEIFPIGTPIPTTRTTEYGNVYDVNGNLVSGTGLKTGVPGNALAGKTPEQIAAYNSAKELAQSFVAAYGGKLSDYFDATTGRVTSPTKDIIAKALASQNNGNVTEVSRVTNADGSVTVKYSNGTTKTFANSAAANTATPIVTTTSPTDTGPVLASDVFKQTLATFFGAAEMAKPWANELYKVVSKFYKLGGVTPEEAFNMALLESRTNPALADFTKRFKGIFALQDMKQQGKAVTVPTIAEYFATESKMGDMLKASNLGELANEDFLGDVLSKGVSATEFGNRLTQIFDRIDTAPDVIKKTISRYFPSLDRTQLAKALALGDKGAKQLEQELAGYEVLAGAGAQGLETSAALPGGVTLEQAQQIAKAGGTFASTLPQFGQIARARETEQKLAEISGIKSIGVTGLTSAVISKSAAELKKLEDLTMQEEARFAGKAGTSPRALASQSRANRII
jgi:hypothetical protein